MCGIAGIIKKNINNIDINLCKISRDLILHRGPDNNKINIYSDAILIHTRLAIQDLSNAANQPFALEPYLFELVFNGEIYNFLELKKELKRLNYVFNTESDTEVLYFSLIEWGVDALSKLEGMYAFVFYNKENNSALVARDRLGVKPLFYNYDESTGGFKFSSELKSLLAMMPHPENDHEYYSEFLMYGSLDSPRTPYKSIYQVEPGHYIYIKDGILEVNRYWSYPSLRPNKRLSENEVLKKVKLLLIDSIEKRLASDVKTGLFLSGGIDSTLIGSIISKEFNRTDIPAYTAYYENVEDRYNEHVIAEEVAKILNIELTKVPIETSLDMFNKSLFTSDELFANQSIIPYLELSKIASSQVKVIISGEGGDEFFCGYSSRKSISLVWKYLSKIPIEIRSLIAKFLTLFAGDQSKLMMAIRFLEFIDISSLIASRQAGLSYQNLRSLFNNELKYKSGHNFIHDKSNSFRDLCHYAGNTYLPNVLFKTSDRASMRYGLEARLPFDDHKIIEYMSTVPDNIAIKNGQPKYLLRKILSEYLPRQVYNAPKRGFSFPLKNYITIEMINEIEKFHFHGIEKKALSEIIQMKKNGQLGLDAFLYKFLILKMHLN